MMKKTRITIYILGLLLTGILAACGSTALTAKPNPAADVPPKEISLPTEAPATIPVETTAPASSTTFPASVSFTKDVFPILQQHCSNCHGGSNASGGFQINTYKTIMAGSRTGVVILPGDGQNSYIIQLVQNGTMPRRGTKLTNVEIQIIIDWINAGALDN